MNLLMKRFTQSVGGRMMPIVLASLIVGVRSLMADDWGAYSLIPASAPGLVLEAVGAEAADGTMISIGQPSGSPLQKWVVVPKEGAYFSIKLGLTSKLVLSAAKGGTQNGTRIVLEVDSGQPWQEWKLNKNDDDSYSILPRHIAGMGLDHLGGKPVPGAQIDLWSYKPGDQHLNWFIRPLAGSIAPASGTAGASPPSAYVAPEIKPESILKGELKSTVFSSSRIFPGTHRQVHVFVPAQYDGAKPACVYVKTDGFNPKEQSLLETLIATGEMPVTVGVFVKPGDLPATVQGTMGRRNRCLEYDGMGDNNVRFLIEELLPFVAREFNLNLSTSGNDRCIAGGSSGGIAAFNAAWERPDAFSRVYANSGSFVAFRGGHEFPTMVRKFEARPIRAYLTTGMRDMENCAGDWFLLDQEMDKALKFSGYDYSFRIINGGHVAGYYDHYQEAMSYLWKDWPQPVKAGPSAPRVRDVILPDEDWQLVSQGWRDARGPACNADGEVYFVDTSANKLLRIDGGGQVHEFLASAEQANSVSVGPRGDIYTVSMQTGRVMVYDSTGKGWPVTDGLPGRQILAMPDGSLYVTAAGSVWHVQDGKKTEVDSGLKLATGLAYRPDQWLLSVADGHSKWAYSYQINGDGSLANKERYYWSHVPDAEDDAGAESVCYAKEGPMLVATRWGIQICADDGPTQVILPLPDRSRPVGVCLGGKEMDRLYAFCGDKVWKRKVKIHGIGAFSPWTGVTGSKL